MKTKIKKQKWNTEKITFIKVFKNLSNLFYKLTLLIVNFVEKKRSVARKLKIFLQKINIWFMKKEMEITCRRTRSSGLKSLGEQPHQSTICLYWHRHPNLRFQLVKRKFPLANVSQNRLLRSTTWKND